MISSVTQCESKEAAFTGSKVPNFGGRWKIDSQRSDDEPIRELMCEIGTPRYLVNLAMLFPSTMKVNQTPDNLLIHEKISQAKGLYVHDVKIYTDNREVTGKHPIDRSVIRTRTQWKELKTTDLASNSRQEHEMCCVSEIKYEKYPEHMQETIRFLEDDGETLHVIHHLKMPQKIISAHRFLTKIVQ